VALAGWTHAVRPSVIGEMLAVMARPDVTSFALGLAAPELFPVGAFAEATCRVLAGDRSALQYTTPYAPLREQVVELMRLRGVRCAPEQVFITTAAQQGLSLLARLFLDEGGEVLCERLVYSGFKQTIDPLRARVLAVPSDPATGMDVDAVEHALRGGARPAFVYVITDGHNPLGASLAAGKRAALVELAHRYGVPIVEDDAYGLLHYAGAPVPPLRALDDELVFYVGSFSKILAPGFRVGWIVAPARYIPLLGCAKDGSDINTCTLSQRVLSAYLETGAFPGHLAAVCAAYRERRDAMSQALARHLSGAGRWHVPQNGTLIWLELEDGADTTALLRTALEMRVAYVPGEAFAVDGSRAGSRCMRLNFSRPSVDEIRDGIARLACAVRMGHAPANAPAPGELPS
jgi:2-aminoadipate transaminase